MAHALHLAEGPEVLFSASSKPSNSPQSAATRPQGTSLSTVLLPRAICFIREGSLG